MIRIPMLIEPTAMLSKLIRVSTPLTAIALLVCSASTCFGQPQEVREGRWGLQPKRPTTSCAEIRRAINLIFDTRNFHEERPFGEFVKQFEKGISKNGKEVQI